MKWKNKKNVTLILSKKKTTQQVPLLILWPLIIIHISLQKWYFYRFHKYLFMDSQHISVWGNPIKNNDVHRYDLNKNISIAWTNMGLIGNFKTKKKLFDESENVLMLVLLLHTWHCKIILRWYCIVIWTVFHNFLHII